LIREENSSTSSLVAISLLT